MFVFKRILTGLTICLFFWPAKAAAGPAEAIPVSNEWQFHAWHTDEGLPDNGVTGVGQTPDGFLWVATLGGLMRFDGVRFEEFSLAHFPDVPNHVVRLMLLEPSGRMWLVMDRGPLVYVDRSAARVFTSRDGLPDLRVNAMAPDNHGGIWLAYARDFLHVAGGTVTRLGPETGVPAGQGGWVATDQTGTVWFASGGQVGTVSQGKWQAEWDFHQASVRLAAARPSGLWVCAGNTLYRCEKGSAAGEVVRLPAEVLVQVLLEDREGSVWIGSSSLGLFRWSHGTLERVPTSNSQIFCLAEGREGNLWVGTEGGGLNRLRLRTAGVIGAAEGLPFESIRSVCEDAQGEWWAAADNGCLLRRAAGKWAVAGAAEGWSGVGANCVTADRQGAVWVGTTIADLVRLDHGASQEWRWGQGLRGGHVRSLLVGRNGDLWAATGSPNRLYRLRAGKLQPVKMAGHFRILRALAETPDGIVWAGTSEGQLLRVDPKRMVAESVFREQRLFSIRCLLATPDGSLWIGYAGSGVGRWKDGRLARITSTGGLYDDHVSQMLADNRGGLWINSNHGLFMVRLQELVAVAEGRQARVRSIIYGRSDGLPSLEPRSSFFPSAWRLQDGSLVFALRNGLAMVQPDRISENPEPPPVVLERVALDDRTLARYAPEFPLPPIGEQAGAAPQSVDRPLQVPPGYRKLAFEFTALSYTSPKNVEFRYRLSNFDRRWSQAGPAREVSYPRLPAGTYRFQVQACNDNGVWNEAGQQVAVRVLPFFWQTWWFRLGLLAVFTAGVIGVVRYFSFRRLRRQLDQLERQAELQRERTRIARDMHDEVGAKLSRLSLLSDLAVQQTALSPAARGEVNEISETAREAIRSFEEVLWTVNPRNDSLPNLVQFLCRCAEELFEGTQVQCAFDLPEDISPVEISTEARHHVFLAAKEALNNVFKHAGARRVWVRLRTAPGGVEIQVEDDGRGFAPGQPGSRAGGGNGLDNMRQRMQAIGGRLELCSEPGHGARVSFFVPCPQLSPA